MKTPVQQPGAEELTQQAGFSVNTVTLLTGIGSMVVLSSLAPNVSQQKLAWR